MQKRKDWRATVLRRQVEARAGQRCEYCHAPQRVSGYRFHLDHVVPRTQRGSDRRANRALACAPCNLAKLDRTTGIDPQTGDEVALFNPRMKTWENHFSWADDGKTLLGRTSEGRATLVALDMNNVLRMEALQLWFATGWLP